MNQELTVARQGDLVAQMEWAKAAASAAILPEAYRGKPADVMIAANLGASMGLSPAEALYRIAVIKGKPTASAELIAANVRKAGHRLRVIGDDTKAVASIWRADDPEFEFREEWTIERAAKMGLTNNDNWKKQPGTMLKWRAITACARLACPEALYGVGYVPDEIGDSRPEPAVQTVAEALAVQAEVVPDAAPDAAEAPAAISKSQSDGIGKQIRRTGITKDDYLALASEAAGRVVAGTAELTEAEADAVLKALAKLPAAEPVASSESTANAQTAMAAVRAALDAQEVLDV